MVTQEVLELAQKVWDYHHVNHSLEKCDCILTLGSHDTRVAERSAQLFLEGYAPLLIFSGGLGRLTEGVWNETEAELFANIAISMGVPKEKILIENRSTNTGENILFTQRLLEDLSLDPQSFIVVQKPYMERRSYATFKKHWPDKKFVVTSPQILFDDYSNDEFPLEHVISIMIGDLQRIRVYPEKGFQVYQHIPEDVWLAYERLVELGFNKQLLKESEL